MLSQEFLSKLSFKSQAGKSLRNTIRKFDKELLVSDVTDCIRFYNENIYNLEKELNSLENPASYRVKSLQSALLKIDRHKNSRDVRSLLNDILSIRIIMDYEDALKQQNDKLRMVDMRNGKKNDDGYRGIHFYYHEDNFHYPIEIQVWNEADKRFNHWMHIHAYKKMNNKVGQALRIQYDKGEINTQDEFEEALYNELSSR